MTERLCVKILFNRNLKIKTKINHESSMIGDKINSFNEWD